MSHDPESLLSVIVVALSALAIVATLTGFDFIRAKRIDEKTRAAFGKAEF